MSCLQACPAATSKGTGSSFRPRPAGSTWSEGPSFIPFSLVLVLIRILKTKRPGSKEELLILCSTWTLPGVTRTVAEWGGFPCSDSFLRAQRRLWGPAPESP